MYVGTAYQSPSKAAPAHMADGWLIVYLAVFSLVLLPAPYLASSSHLDVLDLQLNQVIWACLLWDLQQQKQAPSEFPVTSGVCVNGGVMTCSTTQAHVPMGALLLWQQRSHISRLRRQTQRTAMW
jgi:hypothetical protein